MRTPAERARLGAALSCHSPTARKFHLVRVHPVRLWPFSFRQFFEISLEILSRQVFFELNTREFPECTKFTANYLPREHVLGERCRATHQLRNFTPSVFLEFDTRGCLKCTRLSAHYLPREHVGGQRCRATHQPPCQGAMGSVGGALRTDTPSLAST